MRANGWHSIWIAVAISGCGPRDRPVRPVIREVPPASAGEPLALVPELPTSAHGCDGHYERFQSPQPAAPVTELHIVGVYNGSEVAGAHGIERRGSVDVRVARPGHDVVLVLAAYDPVDWAVTVADGTRLSRVILSGYHAQRARVPSGVPLDIFGIEDQRLLGDGASYGYQWPSIHAEQLAKAAQHWTGLALTSFRGCHQSSHFVIEDGPPTLDQPPADTPLAKCTSVLSESQRCMALARTGSGHRVVAVGLDSGTACFGPKVDDDIDLFGNASLGWIGHRLYACARDRGVVEIALSDGAPRIAPVECEAVTSLGKNLLLMPSFGRSTTPSIERFASFEDLRAGNVAETLQPAGYVSRFAVRGRLGYYANHSTNQVSIVPFGKATAPSSTAIVRLEDYDDWIFGLDVMADGTLVIGSPSRTLRDIRMFDGSTGARLRTFSLGLGRDGDIAGLKCEGP